MRILKSKLAIAVLATAAVCAPVWAGCSKSKAQSLEAELYQSMFTDIDMRATIANLPEAKQSEAQTLLVAIEQVDALFESGVEPSLEEETRYEIANERLFDLFDEYNVEEVEIDVLENLSDEQKKRAFSLIEDIENLQDKRSISDSDIAVLEQKMQEVEALLIQ